MAQDDFMATAVDGPLVSVILPVRNRAASVSRAIESVLAQTYRTLELIIGDPERVPGGFRPHPHHNCRGSAGGADPHDRPAADSRGGLINAPVHGQRHLSRPALL